MSNEFVIVPRTEIGLNPVVLNTAGQPRPPLRNAQYLTVHYTGVNVNYGDPGDTAAEIRAIEKYAAANGKPNEYNWVIHQDDDNLIHEYAGNFVAAHSAGENSIAVGVLFLNGISEPLKEIQIRKFRWLRKLLVFSGGLRPDHQVLPHRRMPGAKTACPGELILSRWEDLLVEYQPPTPIVPPPATNTTNLPTGVPLWVVRQGDYYTKIAQDAYGVTSWSERSRIAKEIEAFNNKSNIHPGEVIKLPGKMSV